MVTKSLVRVITGVLIAQSSTTVFFTSAAGPSLSLPQLSPPKKLHRKLPYDYYYRRGGKGGKGGKKAGRGFRASARLCEEEGRNYGKSGKGGMGKAGMMYGMYGWAAMNGKAGMYRYGKAGMYHGRNLNVRHTLRGRGGKKAGISEDFCGTINAFTDDSFPTAAPTSLPETLCGCESCTEQVWDSLAGGFSCGERIQQIHGEPGYPTHWDACAYVALEFASTCGACHPVTCDSEIAPTPTVAPEEEEEIVTNESHCGCAVCNNRIWNNDAEGHTCGDRILWLQNNDPWMTEEEACRAVGKTEHPLSCGDCDPDTCGRPIERCGCKECDDETWNANANGFTCGERVEWVMGTGETSMAACALVASEFPTICGHKCDPNRCDGRGNFAGAEDRECDTPALTSESDLYCFPPYDRRVRWENVWGKYIVEVKESNPNTVCGPNDNVFSRETVSLDEQNDKLTLQYKMVEGTWNAAEVRIVLPEEDMPYQYGTFDFSLESVHVYNVTTGQLVSQTLPPSLVLSMFTWDTTDTCHKDEELKREVDIEISRWDDPNNLDAQFLVQPAEFPHLYRFSTGGDTGASTGDPDMDFSQGGSEWGFTWNPGQLSWYSSAGGLGGKTHSYTTRQATELGLPDRVQCLPADIEIRVNLWHMFSSFVDPTDMSQDLMVEVVISNFQYTPSGLQSVSETDGVCTRNCQCGPNSICANGSCANTLG